MIIDLDPDVLMLAEQADSLDEIPSLPLEQLPPLFSQFIAVVDLLLYDT